jgi:hypothetical protein
MAERKTRVRKSQIKNVDKTDFEAIGETAGYALIAQGDDTVDFQKIALPEDVEVFYIESEAITSTNSQTYVEKVRLSFTPSTSGDYSIEWSAELNAGQRIGYKIEQDDSVILNEGEVTSTPYINMSSFKIITGVADTPITIDLDVLSTNPSSINVRRARLIARKI